MLAFLDWDEKIPSADQVAYRNLHDDGRPMMALKYK
jgi:hypothetical protein